MSSFGWDGIAGQLHGIAAFAIMNLRSARWGVGSTLAGPILYHTPGEARRA